MFNKRNPERKDTMNPGDKPDSTPATKNPTSHKPTTPSASGGAPAGASTVLAEGCKFEGQANVEGTFRIEGNVKGKIETTDSLVVAKTGEVEAQIKARRAIVNGRLTGQIHATDRVELQSGGRVDAEIRAKNMVMEDGVRFEGPCQIGS